MPQPCQVDHWDWDQGRMSTTVVANHSTNTYSTQHCQCQALPDQMTNDVHVAVFHPPNPCGKLPALIVASPDDQMTHVLLMVNPNFDWWWYYFDFDEMMQRRNCTKGKCTKKPNSVQCMRRSWIYSKTTKSLGNIPVFCCDLFANDNFSIKTFEENCLLLPSS